MAPLKIYIIAKYNSKDREYFPKDTHVQGEYPAFQKPHPTIQDMVFR